MNKEEYLYIWDSLPTNGYGIHYALIVKASGHKEAFEIAKVILKKGGFEEPDVKLMVANSPDIYYLKPFEGRLIEIPE